MTLPERQARTARAVGYGGLALGAVSVGLVLLAGRTQGFSLYGSAAFALATLLTGIVAVMINRRTLAPQPVSPVFALLFGIVLVGGHIFIAWALSRLAHMH